MALISDRRSRAMLDAGLTTLLVLSALGLGLVVAGNTARRWDVSAQGHNTLSPALVQALRDLDGTDKVVRITAFSAQRRSHDANRRDQRVKDLLAELAARSEQVETAFFDFDAEPTAAERLEVTQYGAMVLVAGERRVDLGGRELFPVQRGAGDRPAFMGEPVVARALQQLVREQAPVLCAIEGHGERRLSEAGVGGLAGLGQALVADGWGVKRCDLLVDPEGALPESVRTLLWASPRMPIAQVESARIGDWLRGGGGLVVLLDADALVPDLVEQLGVTVPEGELRDPAYLPPSVERPRLRVQPHASTATLRAAGASPVLSTAVALHAHALDGITSTALLTTSDAGTRVAGDAQVLETGELVAATAIEVALPHPLGGPLPARVVVVGDADWVGDALLAQGSGNRELALSLVRWTAGEGAELSLDLGEPAPPPLVVSAAQLWRAQLLLLGLLPGLALALGLLIARSRGRA